MRLFFSCSIVFVFVRCWPPVPSVFEKSVSAQSARALILDSPHQFARAASCVNIKNCDLFTEYMSFKGTVIGQTDAA